jgi:RNA-binding protein
MHELIKIKFNEFKEKEQKKEVSGMIEKKTGAEMIGMIGHTAIFYRQQKDAEKRKIVIPNR